MFAIFVKKALDGEPLTVAGDGQQFRNYVYVSDLADAHALVLDDAAQNEVIALDGNERVTVLEIAETVQAHFPGTRIEQIPGRRGDFKGIDISNAHAEQLIGWRPTTSFRDGMRQYVEWYLTQS